MYEINKVEKNDFLEIKKKLINLINQNDVDKLNHFLLLKKPNLNKTKEKKFDCLVYSIENNATNKIIELLINYYENLNFETDDGKVPLFQALENNNFYISNLLLSQNANINYYKSDGNNILFYLFKEGKLNLKNLKYMLIKGVKVNKILLDLIKDKVEDENEYYKYDENVIRNNRKCFEMIKLIFETLIFSNSFILHFIILLKKKKYRMNKKKLKKYY